MGIAAHCLQDQTDVFVFLRRQRDRESRHRTAGGQRVVFLLRFVEFRERDDANVAFHIAVIGYRLHGRADEEAVVVLEDRLRVCAAVVDILRDLHEHIAAVMLLKDRGQDVQRVFVAGDREHRLAVLVLVDVFDPRTGHKGAKIELDRRGAAEPVVQIDHAVAVEVCHRRFLHLIKPIVRPFSILHQGIQIVRKAEIRVHILIEEHDEAARALGQREIPGHGKVFSVRDEGGAGVLVPPVRGEVDMRDVVPREESAARVVVDQLFVVDHHELVRVFAGQNLLRQRSGRIPLQLRGDLTVEPFHHAVVARPDLVVQRVAVCFVRGQNMDRPRQPFLVVVVDAEIVAVHVLLRQCGKCRLGFGGFRFGLRIRCGIDRSGVVRGRLCLSASGSGDQQKKTEDEGELAFHDKSFPYFLHLIDRCHYSIDPAVGKCDI